MSKIAYDPVKDGFAGFIKRNRFLRTIFYNLLDLFFLRSWHVRKVVRDLAKHEFAAKPVVSIFDAGCGFGQYDRFLLNDIPNARVRSVDVKKDYLEDCEYYFKDEVEKGFISFRQEDLLELENEEPKHDLAIIIDVLEHIEEDVKVMRNVGRSLKSGGFFLMHSPSHLAEEDAGDDEFFVDEHARAGYSRKDISDKLQEAGLQPVQVHYTYGKWGHAAWVMLIKWPMLWLTKVGVIGSVLLPFYYLPTLPLGLLFMKMDVSGDNDKGTGIYALAVKP